MFDDVEDLDMVAAGVVEWFSWNQGQVCSAHTRLLVHESIKRSLLGRVVQLAGQIEPRDPLDEGTEFGPLASPAQRDRVRGFVERGEKAGARAVLRGRISDSGGCYVAPTVFDNVHSTMEIVREEIFGPVLCVQTFRNEEEAVALANCTQYGLMTTLWTRLFARAARVSRAIRSGEVWVRSSGKEAASSGCILGCEPQKASGFGAEAGVDGLRAYSTLKLVNFTGS